MTTRRPVWLYVAAAIGIGALAAFAMFATVVMVGTSTDAEHAALDAKDAAVASEDTNAQIFDCLSPKGECFKRAQASTAEAVGSINRITIYAAACAAGFAALPEAERIIQTQQCVIEKLATDDETPGVR